MNRPDDQNNDNWFRLLGQIVDPLDSINRRDPTPNDVLLGRGKGNQRHAGNVDFLLKIDKHMDLYHQQERGNKQRIAAMIIKWVHERNGSFLRQTFEGNWVEVSESTAKDKVSQAFRHRRKQRLLDSTPKSDQGVHAEARSGNLKVSTALKKVPSDEALWIWSSELAVRAEVKKNPPVPDLPDGKAPPSASPTNIKCEKKRAAIGASLGTKISGNEDSHELLASAIGDVADDMEKQACLKDEDVFQLLLDYPSQSPISFKESESSICQDDNTAERSSLSHPGGPLAQPPQYRPMSDEIVSDADILAVIKSWDA